VPANAVSVGRRIPARARAARAAGLRLTTHSEEKLGTPPNSGLAGGLSQE
jgi:hypothetical protein